MKSLDLVNDRVPFFGQCPVDDVGRVLADHRLIGRDHDHVEPVNRTEFFGLGLGSTGHAAELLVHTKVVLQRDGRQRLIFAFDLDALFGLNSLMQAVRPTTPVHQAARKVVNDDDLAVLDDVMMVELIQRVSLESLFDAMEQVHIRRVIQVRNAQQAFGL